MAQPSAQFIKKLEQDLRVAYVTQFKAEKQVIWPGFRGFLISVASAAFVVAMLLFNFGLQGNIFSHAVGQTDTDNDLKLITLNDESEEKVIRDIDSGEIKQIYNNLRLFYE